MLIIGLETSGSRGSVALCRDEEPLCEVRFEQGQRHARNIMVAVDEVVRRAGVSKSEIDAVAVSQGPGSFTGLRVGVTCAKTLCHLMGWQAVGVPSLEVIAQNVDARPDGAEVVCPLLDARREFVYATVFRWENGRWRDLTGVIAGRPEQIAERIPRGALVFGSGVDAYRAVFLGTGKSPQRRAFQEGPPCLAEAKARHVAALGARKLREGGGVSPMLLNSNYYRRTEAEERLATGS